MSRRLVRNVCLNRGKPMYMKALSTYFIVPTAFCMLLAAQGNVTADLARLSSDHWQERAVAVGQITLMQGALDRPDVQNALVKTLEREDSVLDGTGGEPDALSDESYAEYLNIIEGAVEVIAKKTGDQRAYDALLKSAYNSDSPFGDWLASRYENLPTLIELTQSSNLGSRSTAVGLIGKILKKSKSDPNSPLTPQMYRDAKSRIVAAATAIDENPIVRQMAVRSLGRIGDQSDAATLQRIAQSDPTSYRAGAVLRFPIREEAMRALNSIHAQAPTHK